MFGWFPDPEMPWNAPIQLVKELDRGKPHLVLEALSEHFQERVDDVESEIGTLYPSRKHILVEAFEAHREGKYNLAIPVFLAQSDGFWHDQFQKSVFRQAERHEVFAKIVSENKKLVFELLATVVDQAVPLWVSRAGRPSSFSDLNRHQVLHGECVDYGTEQNSLKAISFLNWLGWVLKELQSS